MNPRGQITQEQLGNGLVANKAYDAVTGLISSIQCGVNGGACSQNQSYLWDKVGNLIQRQNGNLGLTENFYYDNLHRLDYSQLNGVTNLDMSYDALGNITNRTDVANNAAWQYDAVHKHQVKQAGSGNTYTYDANGNVTARNGNSINWTSYNYASQITGAGETINLYYDANRQRYKQVYNGNGVTETTLYIGGQLQKVSANGVDDYRYTIVANGQTIAIMSRTSSGNNTTRYVLNDYQGSVAKFTDSSGNSIVSESFTAFGARRNPQTWSGQPTYGDQNAIANIAREGYIGHTALGTLSLNHMNGRVQDAITGRFLSADPYITEPGNTQNYNRYSYVLNNPMSFIEPTGFDQDGCGGWSDSDPCITDGSYGSGGGGDGGKSNDCYPCTLPYGAYAGLGTYLDQKWTDGSARSYYWASAGNSAGLGAAFGYSDYGPSGNDQGPSVGPPTGPMATPGTSLQAASIASNIMGGAMDGAENAARFNTNANERFRQGQPTQFSRAAANTESRAVQSALRIGGKMIGIGGAVIDAVSMTYAIENGDYKGATHAGFNAGLGVIALFGTGPFAPIILTYMVTDAVMQGIGYEEGLWMFVR